MKTPLTLLLCLMAGLLGAQPSILASGSSQITGSVRLIATPGVINTNVAPSALQWVKTSFPQYQARVNGVKNDSAGNLIVVGQFINFVDFGSGQITSFGGLDAFLVKYSPSGVLIWAKGMGGTATDNGTGVTVDSSDNIIMVGNFQGSANISGTTLTATGGSLDTDVFLAKYSSAGTLFWAKGYGSSATDNGNAIAVDSSGNVFAASRSGGLVNFGNGVTATGHGSFDLTIGKFGAAAGVTAWGKMYGGSAADNSNGIAVDTDGNVVITGQVSLAADVDFGNGPTTTNGICVAKYLGSNGSYLWHGVFGGGSGSTGNSITCDPVTKNVLITGAFNGTANFGGGSVSSAVTGIFLAGYNTSGTYIWDKVYKGNDGFSAATAFAVDMDDSGNIGLAGQVFGVIGFDGNILHGNPSACFFVAVFTSSGASAPVYKWGKDGSIGGESHGQSVDFDAFGNVAVGGYFYGTVNFGGTVISAGSGVYNTFSAKYAK